MYVDIITIHNFQDAHSILLADSMSNRRWASTLVHIALSRWERKRRKRIVTSTETEYC